MRKLTKSEKKTIKKLTQQKKIMNMKRNQERKTMIPKKESNMSVQISPIVPRTVTHPFSNESNSRLFYVELINDLYIKSYSDFLYNCSAVCATMFSKDCIFRPNLNTHSGLT
jgi:hypothetical protein